MLKSKKVLKCKWYVKNEIKTRVESFKLCHFETKTVA